jgi:hypothetical protein
MDTRYSLILERIFLSTASNTCVNAIKTGCRMSGCVQVFGRRHEETSLALMRPASKKRQGTKSREVWRRLGSERYGDLIFAPAMMGAMLAQGDLHGCGQGSQEGCTEHLGRSVDHIDG